MGAGRLAFPASLMVVALLASRHFAAETMGRYGLAVTAVIIFAGAGYKWLEQAVIRFFNPKETTQPRTGFVSQVFGIALMIGAAIGIVGLLAGAIFSLVGINIGGIVMASGAAAAAFATFGSLQAFPVAALRNGTYAVVEVARASVVVLVVFFAFVMWNPREVFLLTILAAGTIVAIGVMLLAWRYGPMRLRVGIAIPSKNNLRNFLGYGMPLAGWIVGAYVLSLADRFLIQAYLGSAKVGIYYLNYEVLPGIVLLVLGSLVAVMSPALIRLYDRLGREAASTSLNRHTTTFLFLSLPLATAIAVISRPLSAHLFRPAFADGSIVVPWIIFGLLGWNLGMLLQQPFAFNRTTRPLLGYVAVGSCINIGLNVLLIPTWGIEGAAVATFISYWAYPTLVVWGSIRRWRTTLPWRAIFSGVAAVTIGSAVGRYVVDLFPAPLSMGALGLAALASFLAVAATFIVLGRIRISERRLALD